MNATTLAWLVWSLGVLVIVVGALVYLIQGIRR